MQTTSPCLALSVGEMSQHTDGGSTVDILQASRPSGAAAALSATDSETSGSPVSQSASQLLSSLCSLLLSYVLPFFSSLTCHSPSAHQMSLDFSCLQLHFFTCLSLVFTSAPLPSLHTCSQFPTPPQSVFISALYPQSLVSLSVFSPSGFLCSCYLFLPVSLLGCLPSCKPVLRILKASSLH